MYVYSLFIGNFSLLIYIQPYSVIYRFFAQLKRNIQNSLDLLLVEFWFNDIMETICL